MTDATIMGSVIEPRTGVAAFGFYTGSVSIRDRGGYMEVAFFAPSVKPRLPMEGLLDGVPVIVTGVSTRELDPTAPALRRSGALRPITAIVIPATPA